MDVREKLVELLGANTCKHDCCEDCEYCEDGEACIAYLKNSMADYLIAHGVTVQEWISVKDRLPKEDEDIIAFCYYHESWQAQVCHLSSNYEGQWYTSVAGQWVRVTHWMPLPQSPKGE